MILDWSILNFDPFRLLPIFLSFYALKHRSQKVEKAATMKWPTPSSRPWVIWYLIVSIYCLISSIWCWAMGDQSRVRIRPVRSRCATKCWIYNRLITRTASLCRCSQSRRRIGRLCVAYVRDITVWFSTRKFFSMKLRMNVHDERIKTDYLWLELTHPVWNGHCLKSLHFVDKEAS